VRSRCRRTTPQLLRARTQVRLTRCTCSDRRHLKTRDDGARASDRVYALAFRAAPRDVRGTCFAPRRPRGIIPVGPQGARLHRGVGVHHGEVRERRAEDGSVGDASAQERIAQERTLRTHRQEPQAGDCDRSQRGT
jgi:hypothetical protein